jgi:hypothetical protein
MVFNKYAQHIATLFGIMEELRYLQGIGAEGEVKTAYKRLSTAMSTNAMDLVGSAKKSKQHNHIRACQEHSVVNSKSAANSPFYI